MTTPWSKSLRLLALAGLAAVLVTLIWQVRTIMELRTEVAGLHKDIRLSLENALNAPVVGAASETEQSRREKLELIKLRHQVRELNEGLVESHARERTANLQSVMHLLLPAAATTNRPGQIRPEWKSLEAQITNRYAKAMQVMNTPTNDYVKFLAMDEAAKTSFALGRTEDARQFATDMLLLVDKYSQGDPEKENGDAVYNGHWILGRIALEEGRIDEARQHLLASAKTKGSPVLGSFGPNLSLDKELLEKGEVEVVLQHLELCRKFWRYDTPKMDRWIKDIQAGRVPDFGANLIY